jgi:hypothetical protein
MKDEVRDRFKLKGIFDPFLASLVLRTRAGRNGDVTPIRQVGTLKPHVETRGGNQR